VSRQKVPQNIDICVEMSANHLKLYDDPLKAPYCVVFIDILRVKTGGVAE
jgi:hypothetical protein